MRKSYFLPVILSGFVVVFVVVPGIWGWNYYKLSRKERNYLSEENRTLEEFHSGGSIGHTYGIAGVILMLLNFLYLYRKRLGRRGEKLGSLRTWMNFHVFFGLSGPILILYHTAFSLTNPFAATSFLAMLIVVITGIIGRFIYAAIPRDIYGRENTKEVIEKALLNLEEKYQNSVDQSLRKKIEIVLRREGEGVFSDYKTAPDLILKLISLKFRFKKYRKNLSLQLQRELALSSDEAELLSQVCAEMEKNRYLLRVLEQGRRALSSWRAIHRNLTFVMVITALVHVFIATLGFGLLGY